MCFSSLSSCFLAQVARADLYSQRLRGNVTKRRVSEILAVEMQRDFSKEVASFKAEKTLSNEAIAIAKFCIRNTTLQSTAFDLSHACKRCNIVVACCSHLSGTRLLHHIWLEEGGQESPAPRTICQGQQIRLYWHHPSAQQHNGDVQKANAFEWAGGFG